jgi:photosystem II stability/assembly factor-like uncharacterized protein
MLRRLGLFALTLVVAAPLSAQSETPAWVATHPVQQQSEMRLSATSDGGVWAVVDHNRVLRSADGGETWLPVNPVPVQSSGVDLPYTGPALGGSSDTLISGVSTKVAWGANGRALSRTGDSGTTWRQISTPSVTRSKFFEHSSGIEALGRSIWYFRGGSEVVGSCPYPLPTTPVLSSSNDGARWQRGDVPVQSGDATRVRFVDARRGMALVIEYDYTETTDDGSSCGYSGSSKNTAVVLTTDGGRTWRRTLTCPGVCSALAWVSPKRVLVGARDGRLYASNDGGLRFQSLGRLFEKPLSPVYGFDAMDFVGKRGWAAVNGVGIFRSDDGGAEWLRERSSQDAFFLALLDLTAVDKDRAVSVGPYSLITRLAVPAAPTGPASPGRLARPDRIDLGRGRWLGADGVVHVDVRLERSA